MLEVAEPGYSLDTLRSYALQAVALERERVAALAEANLKLVGALDMIREQLTGGNVQDLLYIINTAIQTNRCANIEKTSS